MRAYGKNTLREITKSKSRFFSILLICAIGVGFFSGVRATGGDMRVSADDYYDANDLFDLRVLSTFGLTDDDLDAIRVIDGVDVAVASKYTDLLMHSGDNEYITRVYSQTPDDINKIEIYSGRAPQADDEAIVNCGSFSEKQIITIGETITLQDPTNADEFPLKRKEYKVVGMYNTPMFISKTQRGSTNIGDGVIDALMIVPETEFTQEPYTEIYIKSNKLKDMQSYSDEYEDLREEISQRLEELGEERSVIRYNEVLGEAQEKISDGERELEKAKIEGQKDLDDAKKQLDEAKQQIEDGEKELEDAKKEIENGNPKLKDAEKKLADARKELDDAKKELEDAKKELDDGKKALDEAREQLDNGEDELAKGKIELDAALEQIEQGEKELAENKKKFEESLAEAGVNPEEVKTSIKLLERGIEELKKTIETLPEGSEERKAAEDGLVQAEAALAYANEQSKEMLEAEAQINAAEETLAAARKEYEKGLSEYNTGLLNLYNGRRSYDHGLEEYLDGLQKYTDGYEKYAEGEVEYYDGYTEYSVNKEKLDLGWDQYEEGKKALDEAKEKYEQGLIDYEDGLEEYNTKIADAEKELADAREKIEDAGNAQWYVFTRDDNQGYSEYKSNAERIDRIAAIFPLFFLLVAGLVCLTTMSRMVEEQRTQIGTLKALGYSRGAIMRHYMTYAVTAALVGGVIGAIGGCYLFPSVIVYAYSMLYKITDIHYMFTASNLILSIGSMTLAIALTVYFSCDKALKETPASLMRPKAPKAGKRIFLEKINFIWSKMNFFAKVSARNLIRYKRRMLMTIVGIAGCTALSLTGFGLKNSIMDVADLQYTDIYQYSGYLAYKDDIKLSELNSIYKTLTDYEPETEYTRALIKQYDLEHSGNSMQGYITAVENPELFETFVDMRERKSGDKIKFSEQSGAVITEKLAKMLGAKIGDEITVKVSGGVNRKLTISAITEHYAGHYLYVSESDYKTVFGSLPKYNMIYFQNGISMDDDEQTEFTEHVLENKNVAAVMMNAASLNSIHDTMKIMDLVVLVLIVSAAALAFVVLYNLTNVNITERIREIATLKVLGFYDVEVSSYVFRESIVLSLLGALVGLGLGVALCMFVINTAEIDEIMFGRKIHAISYLWAFLVTAAFSLIVNLIMTRVLKKISMVESLKSVE